MVRKITALFLSLLLVTALSACSQAHSEEEASAAPSASPELSSESSPDTSHDENAPQEEQEGELTTAESSSILVAYFSWADNAVVEDDVDAVTSPSVIAPGNVAQLASWVQEATDGDLFSIRVTEPYSSDWDECLARANEERSGNARPELMETVENIENYDVVFLGYPNWWYGAPMALLSFIEENDLSDKQIYLFCSHGTGGLAGSVEDIESVLPDTASLSDSVFDVYEEDAPGAQDDILSWLSELGY